MREAQWKPLDSCDGLPGVVEDWLAEPGSLTARVRARCGEDFRFRRLDQRYEQLAIFPGDVAGRVLVREIVMGRETQPLVFARTRVPQETLAAHPWLAALGEQPMGTRLFDEPGYMRGRFYVARLAPGDELYDYVNRRVVSLNNTLWARRARVELQGKPFEICECFLPGLI